MTQAHGDARSRLPREPYPGLRPFLDFEAALLFGRERQVREVIEHLRQTQFVAVLGGSGSGKSSLIHAGVVPALRSFGLPGEGDLWLPMTCTPGTNVSAADSAVRRHSPVTRLARRFAGLLRSRGSAEADARRQADIAEVFRQEAGFARLIDVYGAELELPPGPDAADARVLFVLDQFEEVFHPTNKGVADATLLVERVLDHFFNPHPRCHVVLTMRSEHLNDCATFLELPDAINKSSYLVRRLDDDELRAAITGPAQRFLRLMARSREPDSLGVELPAEVHFEDAVLERLLRDVKALTHDPDHLPLLQHLLARLWAAALEREEMDVPVPAYITEIDLVRAVAGGQGVVSGDEQALDERSNTLRACVENWPETLYRWQGQAQRDTLDALFSRLAYKDPNTGMYSQQRIDVDEVAPLLAPGLDRTGLRALLAEGFLGAVDYLFWDDEDPARVTLKVSHESFIRGWSRFRELVDREAERFEEFAGVMRRCSAWAAGRRSDDLLLEGGEMRLLRESGFEARLRAPGQHESWFRFLLMQRDGARLSKLAGDLDPYLRLSSERLRSRERASRKRRIWTWASVGTLLLLPPAFFSAYVQVPVTHRNELLLAADARADVVVPGTAYEGVGGGATALASLLRAAELVEEARHGRSSRMTRFSQWLLDHLSWIPPVARQAAFLTGVTALAEPQVNERLRRLLSGAVWVAPARPAGLAPEPPPALREARCLPRPEDAAQTGSTEVLQGRLLLSAQRGLLAVDRNDGPDAAISLRRADVDALGVCSYGPVIAREPLDQDPRIVVDRSLRYALVSTSGPRVEQPTVAVYELGWDRADSRAGAGVRVHARAKVTGLAALAQVRQVAGAGRLAVVDSWPLEGGRALALGGAPWRMVASVAQPLTDAAGRQDFLPLEPAPPGSACVALIAATSLRPDRSTTVLAHGGHCFYVMRAAQGEGGAEAHDRAVVSVYDVAALRRAAARVDTPSAPLTTLDAFSHIAPRDRNWRIGVAGAHAGWLAVESTGPGAAPQLLGVPWSTCALWRVGGGLLATAGAAPEAARGDGTAICDAH